MWVARTWVLPWWVNSVQDWRVRVARTWVLPVSITRVHLKHVHFSRVGSTGLSNLLVIGFCVWVARTWVLPVWVWYVWVARTWVLPVPVTRVQVRHVYG